MKSYNFNLLWITLLMLSLHHPRTADSFQCYECENCPTIGENDKKYLKECGLPEIHRPNRPVTTLNWEEEEVEEEDAEVEEDSAQIKELVDTTSTTKSTSTSTVTSTSAATTSSTAASQSTVASSSSLSPTSSSTSSSKPSSTSPSTTIANTTAIIKPTTADATSEEDLANNTNSATDSETSEEKKKPDTWSLFPHSMEENDLSSSKEENQQPKKVRKPRQLPGNKPVCYVLKVKYDGFEVTNRGCGAAVADRNLTCKMLSKGQPYAECGICEGNMCNSAPSVIYGVVGTLYVLALIAVYSW